MTDSSSIRIIATVCRKIVISSNSTGDGEIELVIVEEVTFKDGGKPELRRPNPGDLIPVAPTASPAKAAASSASASPSSDDHSSSLGAAECAIVISLGHITKYEAKNVS